MAIAIDHKDPVGRLAGVLEHPALQSDRIAEYPLPGTATESDLVTPSNGLKHLWELVDGVLVEKARGYFESILAGVLIQLLRNYVDKHKLGIVMGADAPFEYYPDKCGCQMSPLRPGVTFPVASCLAAGSWR